MTESRFTLKRSSDGHEFPIAALMSVGRGDDSQLRLTGTETSRRHARFAAEGATLFVEDLGSANGTFVNDRRLEPNAKTQIKPTDRVRFDTEEFTVRESSPAAAEKARLPDSFLAPTGKQTTYIPPEQRAALKSRAAQALQEAQPAGGLPYLRIISGDRSGTKFELPVEPGVSKTWSIGSQADRDICLQEPEISAKHATLRHDADSWLLSDDLSVNGISVNGEKILTRYLADGDRLQFGLLECEFRIPPRAAPPPKTAPMSKWILIGAAAFVVTLLLIFAVFKMSK